MSTRFLPMSAKVTLQVQNPDGTSRAFGQIAKQWRQSPVGPGRRARPTCRHRRVLRMKPPMPAPLEQLVALTNLESLNSVLIRQGLAQPERLATLNDIAITQMRTLLAASSVRRLK